MSEQQATELAGVVYKSAIDEQPPPVGSAIFALLQDGTLVQSIIALIFCTVVAALALADREIPANITNLLSLIMGFYFANASSRSTQNALGTIIRGRREAASATEAAGA